MRLNQGLVLVVGQTKVIVFIEPPQGDVIEKILPHCCLRQAPTAPPDADRLVQDSGSGCSNSQTACSDQVGELTYVDIGTLLAPLGAIEGTEGHVSRYSQRRIPYRKPPLTCSN